MTKRIIVSAFIASILVYISSAFYFYKQEENLKSTFLENIKKTTRAELIINGFKDTLINVKGDTTFINIPAKIASAEVESYQVSLDN